MAPEGPLVAGRYRLLRTLAVGGMGRVWLATDEMLGCQVAVKKCALPDGLSPAQQEMMRDLTLREARAFARVSHPHVIRILDVLPGEDEPWIVMEYVASRSLLQVIQESGPLPPARVAAVGLAVLQALNAAGRAGVLHLDVKPANVLIGDDGRIVLADFGPAGTDEGVRALAAEGILLGSPKYIAPERLLGGASTAQADLWSLGATLYHAVQGRPPYVRETIDATLQALTDGPPDPPTRAGPLAGVLAGLLRHDPAARLPAAEVEAQLRRIADQPGSPAPVAISGQRRRIRPLLVRRMAAVAAVLAVIAALGGMATATRHSASTGDRPGFAATSLPRAPIVLPRDFRWWNDADGFRVAVPAGWQRSRDAAGGLVFRPASRGSSLRISRWQAPPNVVAALLTQEKEERLAAYRRVRIEALAEPPNAVWEYTFRDPGGEPMHGLQRVLTADGHTYLIEWRTRGAVWATQLQRLAVVLDSFGPAAGA